MQVIHCADVIELAGRVDDTFDVLITDPPYAPRVHSSAITQIAKGGQKRDLKFDALTPALRDAIAWFAVNRVKGWSIIYSDLQGTADWRAAMAGIEHVRDVPWIRWSMPQLSADRPPSGAEMTCWFHPKGQKFWQGPGNLTHLDHSDGEALDTWLSEWFTQDRFEAAHYGEIYDLMRDKLVEVLSVLPALDHACLRKRNKNFHETEKPLKQALDLVLWTTRAGDHVLDLTAGAATIGVACRYLGRRYTGFEKKPEWAANAAHRLAVETALDRKAFAEWSAEYDDKYTPAYKRKAG